MKKVYNKPSVTVVNVKLFGSLLDNPDIGLVGASYKVEDGFAKENDEVVEDDDLSYSPMHTDWSTE